MKTGSRPSTVLSVFLGVKEFHDTMNTFHLYFYGPMCGPIETSFEEAEARLRQLPLLHFEPDGSFVWTRDSGRQQIFGMIYDARGSIQYCDLRGCCSYETWQQLCEAIVGQGVIAGGLDRFKVMVLPNQQLQDLQSFEQSQWPDRPRASRKKTDLKH